MGISKGGRFLLAEDLFHWACGLTVSLNTKERSFRRGKSNPLSPGIPPHKTEKGWRRRTGNLEARDYPKETFFLSKQSSFFCPYQKQQEGPNPKDGASHLGKKE